jgi:hypothetical protein
MLQRLAAGLCLLAMLAWASPPAAAADPIMVLIDGQELNLHELTGLPFILNNRVMVPLRAIAEKLDAELEWIPLPRSIRITKDERNIMVIIDKLYAVVDGENVPLDAAAGIFGGRTYVPLRFIGEAFGLTVRWDPERRAVILETADPDLRREGYRLLVTLESVPVQGAEITLSAAVVDPVSGRQVNIVRSVTLELHHREAGSSTRRAMQKAERSGYFVSHLALYARDGQTFDLVATAAVGDRNLTARHSFTVRGDPSVSRAALELWARGGFRPQFLTPSTDLATGLRMPVSLRAEAVPAEVAQGETVEFRFRLLDAYLMPAAVSSGAGVRLLLKGMVGDPVMIDAVEAEPGLFVVRAAAEQDGYGGAVNWEAQVLLRSNIVARLQGTYTTR